MTKQVIVPDIIQNLTRKWLIGHRFTAKEKKTKNADTQVWGDARGDQKTDEHNI